MGRDSELIDMSLWARAIIPWLINMTRATVALTRR
jgi:hypothetical protein